MTRAKKRFGQHFLEAPWAARVVDACRVQPDDQLVEIGPGRGAITDALTARASRVLAVEVDRQLAAALAARQLPGLTVYTGDVLDSAVDAVLDAWLDSGPADRRFRVVGNLPYNLTSPILYLLTRWWQRHPALQDATVMVQADVADRLVAVPSTGEYGVLTLLTALTAEVTRLLDLPPGAFRPQPAVRSTLVRLRYRHPTPPVGDPALVDRLVRVAFTKRRKTLANTLKALGAVEGVVVEAVLEGAGLDGRRRPETLQLVEFSALADAWRRAAVRRTVL